MSVELIRLRDTLTAAISGEIDHHTARAIRESIDQGIQAASPKTLVLDLSGVSFMDSSGIGLIMGRCKLMNEIGGDIKITGASSGAARMIKLAGLSRLGIECGEDTAARGRNTACGGGKKAPR